ncbi:MULTISPECIES: KxYKxGKxW signal peptide domain-containing protein [unclassified Flavobacterium]
MIIVLRKTYKSGKFLLIISLMVIMK